MAEEGKADWFVIGGKPLSSLPFRIVDMSDAWDAVINGGIMVECTVSMTISEYQ
jgi:hypothetical protein